MSGHGHTIDDLPQSPKIAAPEEAGTRLKAMRSGRPVVFTNGCFDLLHAGHADLLARARALGGLLVVGVNSDASVSRLKGPTRPLVPLAERMFVLAALECVDMVTSFDQDTPLELITRLVPDILVKGGDWPVERIVGREVVQTAGGKVFSLPLLPGRSTTALIRRVLDFDRKNS